MENKDQGAAAPQAAGLPSPGWRSEMWDIHCRVVSHMHAPGSDSDVRFLMLGLAGEVGELANEIKKAWRDDGAVAARWSKIREEYGDALAYLSLLGHALGLDDDRVMLDVVLPKCRGRWPSSGPSDSSARAAAQGEEK